MGKSNNTPPAIKALCTMAKTGKLHHAFLFSGPDGIGKEAVAMQFTEHLMCAKPPQKNNSIHGCGTCDGCIKIANKQHPDLHIIEADGATIKIDAIRQLSKTLHLKSFEGGYKVAVIRKAHLLHINAANALLKTLEEPPGKTVFILVTHLAGLLPATIRSRCQQLNFNVLQEMSVPSQLEQEGLDIKDKLTPHLCIGVGQAKQVLQSGMEEKIQNLLELIRQEAASPDALLGTKLSTMIVKGADRADQVLCSELLLAFCNRILAHRIGEPVSEGPLAVMMARLERVPESFWLRFAKSLSQIVLHARTYLSFQVLFEACYLDRGQHFYERL